MSLLLRLEMITAALLAAVLFTRSINRKRLRIQYLWIWLFVLAAIMAAAFFPGLVDWLCRVMNIQTPANLVYLFGILILLLITFYQTILLSKQSDRITRLTQQLSIQAFLQEKQASEKESYEQVKD